MITTVENFVLRNGHPVKNKTSTNPAGIVISETNPMQPGDVIVTKPVWDASVDAIRAAKDASIQNAANLAQAAELAKQAAKIADTPGLLALGIPQSTIDVLFA